MLWLVRATVMICLVRIRIRFMIKVRAGVS